MLQRWCAWLSGPPLNCTPDEPRHLDDDGLEPRSRARRSARSRGLVARSRSARFRSARSRSARSRSGTSRSARSPCSGSTSTTRRSARSRSARSPSARSRWARSRSARSRSPRSTSPTRRSARFRSPRSRTAHVFAACPTLGLRGARQAAQEGPHARGAPSRGGAGHVRQHHIRRRDRLHAPVDAHGYTVADLINSLPPDSGITYADVLALLLDPATSAGRPSI